LFNLTPKEKKLVVLLGILLAVGLIFRFVIPEKDTFVSQSAGRAQGAGQEETFAGGGSSVQENSGDFFTPEEEKLIVVHITGAVNNPGVYTLTEGSRVFHVVEKAGGQAEDADLEGVNLAQPLYDGQPVFIPRRGDRDFLAPAGGGFHGRQPYCCQGQHQHGGPGTVGNLAGYWRRQSTKHYQLPPGKWAL
jgi:competence protein ComEA